MRASGRDTAVLIDGGFLRKTFEKKFSKKDKPIERITVKQILDNTYRICETNRLFRIYFYDSMPFDGKRKNPISNKEILFGDSPGYHAINAFQNELARSKYIAFRRGLLTFKGWKLKEAFAIRALERAEKELSKSEDKAPGAEKKPPFDIQAGDLMPVLEQKRVDIKIGLDIAWLAIKRIVDRIVIITADSDFIPVMKFARKEGLEVILCSVSGAFKKEILEHVDDFIELNLTK